MNIPYRSAVPMPPLLRPTCFLPERRRVPFCKIETNYQFKDCNDW
jgi:hypothetical protein